MEIRVSGHQIETGEALQAHVSDRMNAIADKYFSRAIGAHAVFGKGPHDSFQCDRSEEHTSELQSLMRISSAVFCLKKKITRTEKNIMQQNSTTAQTTYKTEQ